MNYYEIRDRVPCEEIDALTVEAARVWLTRNGWDASAPVKWKHSDGSPPELYMHGNEIVSIAAGGGGSDRMRHVVECGIRSAGKRAHVVIAEIRAIAEEQRESQRRKSNLHAAGLFPIAEDA